jgi:hypothetical protein
VRARHEQARNASFGAPSRQRERVERLLLRPPVDCNSAVANVDADDQPLAEERHCASKEARRNRGRPDHDPSGTGTDGRHERLARAKAAAGLHGYSGRRAHDTLEESGSRRAGDSTVEVDEMQQLCALAREALGGGHRIASLEGDRVATAPVQTHATPVEDIECGRHDELSMASHCVSMLT